jgi:hypothetical protein
MNHDLAERVFQRIEEDPASFDMDWWARRTSCGTVMCVAGHTVVEGGYEIYWTGGAWSGYYCLNPDGRLETVSDVARRLLDLTSDQAMSLFHPRLATLEDLRLKWKKLTEEEDQLVWERS